jgi:hypothetical protein
MRDFILTITMRGEQVLGGSGAIRQLDESTLIPKHGSLGAETIISLGPNVVDVHVFEYMENHAMSTVYFYI